MNTKDEKRSVSISVYLWSVMAIVVIIISILFLTVFHFISSSIVQNNILYTSQVFKRFESQISSNSNQLENLLRSIAYNKKVTQYLLEKDSTKVLGYMQDVDNLVANVMRIEPLIHQVVVEGENGAIYCSSGKEENIMKSLQNLPELPDNFYDFSQDICFRSAKHKSFLLTSSIYDIWNLSETSVVGQITLVVDMDILDVTKFSDKYDTTLFLADRQNNIIVSNKAEKKTPLKVIANIKKFESNDMSEMNIDNQQYVVNHGNIQAIDAICVSITDKEKATEELNWMRLLVFYMLSVALIMIVFILVFLKYKITAPLKKFGKYIVGIQNETVRYLKKEVNLSGYREIEDISTEFNGMIEQINLLTHQLVEATTTLYEAEIQKKQSELLHLRSQINPHFLYNTLEGILGMSYIENAPQTGKMVKCLATVFKYCVKGNDTVTLKQELDIIKAYVSIQQIRFQDKFDAYFNFEEAALNQPIPKMILQPLVENAIIHGIEGKTSHGNLWIGGCVSPDNEWLTVWIEDDGIGLDDEKLDYFNSIIASSNFTRKSDSIGLENVINRLQLIYGAKAQINICNKKDIGLRIEFTIPFT